MTTTRQRRGLMAHRVDFQISTRNVFTPHRNSILLHNRHMSFISNRHNLQLQQRLTTRVVRLPLQHSQQHSTTILSFNRMLTNLTNLLIRNLRQLPIQRRPNRHGRRHRRRRHRPNRTQRARTLRMFIGSRSESSRHRSPGSPAN